MMGIGTKIRETEKAEQIATLSYEGLIKTIWIPKKMLKKEKKTIDEKRGEVYTLPHSFARAHNIPAEIFTTDATTFCELLNDILPELKPNLDETVVHFSQSVSLPEDALPLLHCGLVPLKRMTTIYFIPAGNIIGFDPRKRAWKILANTDFLKSEEKVDTTYNSFTFIVNSDLWVWKEGTIIPSESFITDEDYTGTVME